MLRFGAFISMAVMFGGCASSARVPYWERAPVEPAELARSSSTAAAALGHSAAQAWRQRDDLEQLRAAIEIWQKLADAESPERVPSLLSLSRAQFFLGQAVLSLDAQGDPEAEARAYELGATSAERALMALAPEFVKALKSGAPKPYEKLKAKGAPAAYWYAVNLGYFAALKGDSAQDFYEAHLRKTMRAVLRVSPELHYGGAERYLGSHHAGLSALVARDLAVSEEYFSSAGERAPQFLLNRLDHAKFLAVERADKGMFETILKEVLKAPDTSDPDIAPENRAAKTQARVMLDLVDQVF